MKTIVGERINTSRKAIRRAVDERDAAFIAAEAAAQAESGATHIDVNAGTHGNRARADLLWLVEVVQDAVDIPLCLDSPDPAAIAGVLGRLDRRPLINSISLEQHRLNAMGAFRQIHDCDIVGLAMSDEGMPRDAGEIAERAGRLIAALEGMGLSRERIFIDPLVQPVGADFLNGRTAVQATRSIREAYPGVHVICGLSNISFGMPRRPHINRCFLTLMMAAGLDAVILDPLDRALMADLTTSRMLLGEDPYCLAYLKACRDGLPDERRPKAAG